MNDIPVVFESTIKIKDEIKKEFPEDYENFHYEDITSYFLIKGEPSDESKTYEENSTAKSIKIEPLEESEAQDKFTSIDTVTEADLASAVLQKSTGASDCSLVGAGDSRRKEGSCPQRAQALPDASAAPGRPENLRPERRDDHPLECQGCGRAFRRKSALAGHKCTRTKRRIHSAERRSQCQANLMGTHLGDGPGSLKGCEEVQRSSPVLVQGGRQSEERPLNCEECARSFTEASKLKRHKQIHTGELTFNCKHCGKSFTHSWNLKRHERIHTGERPFSCEQCGQLFTQHPNLKKHEQIHTGETLFSCEECGRSFTEASKLKRHKRIHTGDLPFSCEHCGKSFVHASNLKMHERIHTGERPFSCDQCGKLFTQHPNLKRHELVHTGERPFSCDECDRSFTEASKLKRHKQIHTGDLLFSCEHCGKSFVHSSNLKMHERIHTGKRPFSCEQWKIIHRKFLLQESRPDPYRRSPFQL